MADTFTPPATVADNARRALEVRASKPPSQRGMTPVGLARARQLANRQPVSLDTVQRMVSYFDRHEVDKAGATWDAQGKGWQAWMGWGGDEGRTWANRILQENTKMETKEVGMTKEQAQEIVQQYAQLYPDEASIVYENLENQLIEGKITKDELLGKSTYKASRRHSEADMKIIRQARKAAKSIASYMQDLGDDGMDMDEEPKSVKAIEEGGEFNTRQRMMVSALVEVTHEAGKFDMGVGANGAHYMPAAKNPFASQGIACEYCYFYQPDGNCAIVEGIVEEYGVCKLWIIPEAVIVEETITEAMQPEAMMEEMDDEVAAIEDRTTTPAQREEMPASDFVIPETRNFPVVTPGDIPAAVSSWGRYRGNVTFEEFKRRLIALAQRKGEEFVARLPQEWKDEMAKSIRLDNDDILGQDLHVAQFVRKLLGS